MYSHRCSVCGLTLTQISTPKGVMIDPCPNCYKVRMEQEALENDTRAGNICAGYVLFSVIAFIVGLLLGAWPA